MKELLSKIIKLYMLKEKDIKYRAQYDVIKKQLLQQMKQEIGL